VSVILDYCSNLPERTFAPGDVLLAEGARSGVLYVLRQGTVEILKGDFRINTVSVPGAIFGEVSVLLDLPHMATVRAVEASRCHVITDALGFLASNAEISLGVAALLARRLHQVTAYLADLKRQFEGHDDHLGMVDEVLESLVHHQPPEQECPAGSDREPDPNY
jgi:CRP/FNR family cyclic AMP-dependent transcriptional regulator